MGKSDRSKQWFVRVTAPHEHIKVKLLELQGKVDFQSSVTGYHVGKKTNKPHAHIALTMKNEVQKQAIDVRMKTLFGVSGADYSSKVWDGSNNAISYMYHDDSAVVDYYRTAFSEEELAKIKQVADVYKDIVTVAKDKASNRMVDVLVGEFGDSKPGIRQIVKSVYTGVVTGRWYSPGFRMRNIVEEIYCKLNKDDAIADLTDRFMQFWEK